MAKFKLNPQGIKEFHKKIDKAFGKVVAKLDAEFQAVIEDPNEFGDIGFTNHDIVLTGRLRDSQTVEVTEESPGEKVAQFSWDPVDPGTGRHYAGDVLTGFRAYQTGSWVPGRDWTERAVERVDPLEVFEDEL